MRFWSLSDEDKPMKIWRLALLSFVAGYLVNKFRTFEETPQATRLRIYKRCIDEVNEEQRRRNALNAEWNDVA